MKKVYKIENLDCPVCAAKMQHNVEKIKGVNSCDVSFIFGKMTIDAQDADFDEIMKKVVKTCKRVEPDFVINQ